MTRFTIQDEGTDDRGRPFATVIFDGGAIGTITLDSEHRYEYEGEPRQITRVFDCVGRTVEDAATHRMIESNRMPSAGSTTVRVCVDQDHDFEDVAGVRVCAACGHVATEAAA